MNSAATFEPETAAGLCGSCGIPLDSQYFDDSSVKDAPLLGEEIVLARFDLPAQYCGLLQYFAQFSDAFVAAHSQIVTPNVEWKLLANNHALFPYLSLRHIVNPWGFGSYPVNIRLDENSTVELVARGVAPAKADDIKIAKIGGRIMGRFWYNGCYGDVEHRSY
jgi:hypothetical protein